MQENNDKQIKIQRSGGNEKSGQWEFNLKEMAFSVGQWDFQGYLFPLETYIY